MYTLTKECKYIDGEDFVLYGIANENKNFGDFTHDIQKAKEFVGLLNEANVDAIHVNDIIEDMFY